VIENVRFKKLKLDSNINRLVVLCLVIVFKCFIITVHFEYFSSRTSTVTVVVVAVTEAGGGAGEEKRKREDGK